MYSFGLQLRSGSIPLVHCKGRCYGTLVGDAEMKLADGAGHAIDQIDLRASFVMLLTVCVRLRGYIASYRESSCVVLVHSLSHQS